MEVIKFKYISRAKTVSLCTLIGNQLSLFVVFSSQSLHEAVEIKSKKYSWCLSKMLIYSSETENRKLMDIYRFK